MCTKELRRPKNVPWPPVIRQNRRQVRNHFILWWFDKYETCLSLSGTRNGSMNQCINGMINWWVLCWCGYSYENRSQETQLIMQRIIRVISNYYDEFKSFAVMYELIVTMIRSLRSFSWQGCYGEAKDPHKLQIFWNPFFSEIVS